MNREGTGAKSRKRHNIQRSAAVEVGKQGNKKNGREENQERQKRHDIPCLRIFPESSAV